MPGKCLPGDPSPAAGWSPPEPHPGKVLYAVDATVTPASPVADVQALTSHARAAVRAGHGHVLDTSHVIFPNGAITLVLILAESHLSIHTWPEEDLIAIDLFSCGAIDGPGVLTELCQLLQLKDPQVRQLERGLARGLPRPGTTPAAGSDRR
jgi:S-adenosylmethionine decarboxylase